MDKKTFKRLKDHWYRVLKDSGFKDIEYKHGQLADGHKDTHRWRDQSNVSHFFRLLDDFLSTSAGIPVRHRQILEKWSAGKPRRIIAEDLGISRSTVDTTIYKYKQIVLSYNLD